MQKTPDILQKGNDVVILVSGRNKEALFDAIKNVREHFGKICYITLNRPYESLVETMKNSGIESSGMNFIDCATGKLGSRNNSLAAAKNCSFIKSSEMLSKLDEEIEMRDIRSDNCLFVFDSLSSLQAYHEKKALTSFVYSIIKKVRGKNARIIFNVMDTDINLPLTRDVMLFADKVINSGR